VDLKQDVSDKCFSQMYGTWSYSRSRRIKSDLKPSMAATTSRRLLTGASLMRRICARGQTMNLRHWA